MDKNAEAIIENTSVESVAICVYSSQNQKMGMILIMRKPMLNLLIAQILFFLTLLYN
jgi:hypothetical protein